MVGLIALTACDDWFVRTLDWVGLQSDPAPETQERLAAAAELSRAWTGDCPDWESEQMLFDDEASARAFEIVQAAVQVGRLDAVHCLLDANYADLSQLDETSAHLALAWVDYALLLGDDPARLEHERRTLEALVSDDVRRLSLELAQYYKRDADWAAAQDWVDEAWLDEGRRDD